MNGLLLIEDEQLVKVSREHCLRSTNFYKPDYVFFLEGDLVDAGDEMFSVMSDLVTVVVTCYGDVKSVNRYHDLVPEGFFIKKVGHRLVFYLTRLQFTNQTSPNFIELLRSSISAPKSSPQEPDHKLQNHNVCSSLQLTEKTSDQTLTHSLSYLREMNIFGPTSELFSLLNNLHHVPRLSKLDLDDVGMGNQECQLLASALKYVDKLRFLKLSQNPLGHGISELAKHLHSVPQLKNVPLNDTQMGKEEVTATHYHLPDNSQNSNLLHV